MTDFYKKRPHTERHKKRVVRVVMIFNNKDPKMTQTQKRPKKICTHKMHFLCVFSQRPKNDPQPGQFCSDPKNSCDPKMTQRHFWLKYRSPRERHFFFTFRFDSRGSRDNFLFLFFFKSGAPPPDPRSPLEQSIFCILRRSISPIILYS